MLRDIRKNYQQFELSEKDLTEQPFELFRRWLDDAIRLKVDEPTAMTLSTSLDGQPDSRVVLLKELRTDGFVFFTNFGSSKGLQLDKNSRAALNFFWPALERQVRVKGQVEKLDEKQAADYFSSRPRDSQLGAWASEQSRELHSRDELVQRFQKIANQYQNRSIDKPPHWGGYVVIPFEIEFWQGRPNRLHDRFRYFLTGTGWLAKRLAP
ncbi:pyridoxamine 5'-phosphate oxidase [Gaoshiqia sediminis]|uniref:Pyridoxine/pyridoxamine 5'-phosphate oxidase n=1 Tax=Gaoshiqia sediminis TaxID=2986998 RepID=A0AA41Y5A4_9BACT|nr:pyridoxamine 5'-phosphate oxidase [Gaoshiqia sediminis]MCW0482199.1 pyridoxamine 5'-phosphate oxidase [Gaoshiqia sediminis]